MRAACGRGSWMLNLPIYVYTVAPLSSSVPQLAPTVTVFVTATRYPYSLSQSSRIIVHRNAYWSCLYSGVDTSMYLGFSSSLVGQSTQPFASARLTNIAQHQLGGEYGILDLLELPPRGTIAPGETLITSCFSASQRKHVQGTTKELHGIDTV